MIMAVVMKQKDKNKMFSNIQEALSRDPIG